MKVDKDPVENLKVDNKSLDFCHASGKTSSSSSSKDNRILSPSSSSSDAERTELDDSDNDSGSVGDFQEMLDCLDPVIWKVRNGTDADYLAERVNIETYDREAILYELAHPENLGVIHKIERMRMGYATTATEISTKPSLNLKNEVRNGDKASQKCREVLTERLRETLQAIPDTLLHTLTGRIRSVDCGRRFDQKPAWLDMKKFRRGQKFAQDHMFSIYFSEMLSCFAIFAFEDSLKPLIMTGKSSTPYTAFKRYLSTGLRVRHWYTQDPWTKGTAAQKDILIVRAKHAAVRRKLVSFTNVEIDAATIIPEAWCPAREILLKDFSETCVAPVIGQCPYMTERNSPDRPKGINQTEMALTQWGFVGLVTSFPNRVGVHYATDEDLEAFCHLWRSIGYQLGIEDEFNFCRGTFVEVRQRSRDFVQTWVKPQLQVITPEWEHMLRCLCTGMSFIIPGITYETSILHLAEILDLKMPRLYASLSYKDWITYNLTKSLMHFTIKLPGVSGLLNSALNRALNQAEQFTPQEFEAIRIRLANYSGNNKETSKEN